MPALADPEVGTDHCPCCPGAYMPHCCWETHGWMLITAAVPGEHARGAALTRPYQGDNDQHTFRKEAESISNRSSPSSLDKMVK